MTEVASLGISVDSAPVKRASSDLEVLSAAAAKAQAASNSFGSVSDKVAKQLAPLTATANRLTTEYSRMVDPIAKTVAQHQTLTRTGELARHEMINLSRQIQDIGVSLLSGQSPFLVGIQQGSQLIDIYGSSKTGTVGGSIKQLGGIFTNFLSPMRALSIGVAASGAAAYAAYGSWKNYTLGLDDAAKAAGTSTASLSKLQGAAQIKGIAPDEFNKGITEFARNVYDAQHGLGELATVFRANNKHASTFDDYMEKAADLIRNASGDQQRLVLLQQMGLPATMEWVRLLNGGAAGLRQAKQEVADFAANDNLIQAARRFDEGWNRAWLNFGRNGKSAIQTALEGMTSLSDKIDGLAKKAGNSSIWSWFLPKDHEDEAKKRGITPLTGFESRFGGDSINPATNNRALQQGLDRRAETLRTGSPTEDYQAELRKLQIDSQRIAQLGQLASVEEVVRQKQNELTAAGKQGYGVSEQQAAAIRNMVRAQEEMSRVSAQASVGIFHYAEAQKAANDTLKFWEDRGFIRSIEDRSAAMNYLNKSLRDTADAAKVAASNFPQLQQAANDATNVYKAMDQVGTSSLATMTTGLADILDGTKRTSDGFRDMARIIIRSLEEAMIKAMIVGPILSAFGIGGGGGGGLGSLLGGLFGGFGGGKELVGWGTSSFIGPLMNAKGNAFDRGNVIPFAKGGVFDSPHVFPMAKGIGLLGEAGPEAIVPLARGRDGKLGIAGGGGGSATSIRGGDVNITIQGNADNDTVAMMKQELARRDAEFSDKVYDAVRRGRAARRL